MKKYLFLVICALSFFNVWAQDSKNVTKPNPVAASFMLYGDIPVSYNNGVPDIRIPLYTIQVGDFSLPIELRYHVRSVKPGSITNVAPGWTLHYGGIVNRTAYGKSDELTTHTTFGTGVGNGNDEWLSGLYGENNFITNYDSETDIFSYDIIGNSGSFIITDTDENGYRQLGGKPIRIQPTFVPDPITPGGPFPFLGFKITDDKGVLFNFGFGSIQSTINGSSSSATTFNLSSIELPGNDTITFGYELVSYYDNKTTQHIFIRDMHDWRDYRILPFPEGIEQSSISICGIPDVSQITNVYSDNHIYENSIKSITFPNGKIEFDLKQGDKKTIEGVRISEWDPSKPEEYNLIKSYQFIPDPDGSIGGRSLLQKVIEKDCNGAIIGEYQLDYSSKTSISDQANTDHWGYYSLYQAGYQVPQKVYSAVNGNTHYYCTPSGYTPISTGTLKATYGVPLTNVLRKITYPTKGYSEFEFESNRLTINNAIVEGNGLRIQQIRNVDNNGNTTIRNYSYVPSSKGSSFLDVEGYANTVYNVGIYLITNDHEYFTEYVNGIGWYRTVDYSSVMNNRIMSTWEPRYETVTESINENYNQGRNVYYFDYKDYDIGFASPMYPSGYSNVGWDPFLNTIKGWDDGNLIMKEVYDNTNTILKRFEYHYENRDEVPIQNTHVKKITSYVSNVAGSIETDSARRESWQTLIPISNYFELFPVYGYYNYNIVTGRVEKTSETETSFFNGNPVTTTTTYEYNGAQKYYPSDIEQTQSDGSHKKTKIFYPYDYLIFGVNDPYSSMTEDNVVAYPVIKEISLDNVPLEAERTDFISLNSSLFKPQAIFSKIQGNDYEERLRYDKYDDKGNIIRVFKAADVEKVYVWGYKQSLPVIEATNIDSATLYAKVKQLKPDLDSFLNSLGCLETEDQKDDWIDFNNSLRNGLTPGSQINTYTYRPLIGMTSQTESNGVTTYYEYDTAGRLKFVKDKDGNILKAYTYNYKQQ